MRPVVLLILDGWGHSKQTLGNAIVSAKTPHIETITTSYPSLLLQASSRSVGLEWGEPGNSEVGHFTLGAGRIIFQYSPRINSAIETGAFFENAAFLGTIAHIQQTGGALHLVGLLGSGTVHSKLDHLVALVELAKRNNVSKLYLHIFTDGRDSGQKEAPELFKKLQEHLVTKGVGKIATFIGRNFPMDRDNNWDLVRQAYELITQAKGQRAHDILAALDTYYNQGLEDSNIPPTCMDTEGIIRDGDGVIFFNFREDSMRQIAHTFLDESFDAFPRALPANLFVALMTHYIEYPGRTLNIAFPLPDVPNGLAQVISTRGKKQLHIAETEKFAHTTYFFNCLRSTPFEGEADILIDSYKEVQEHPEMRAAEIAQKFLEEFSKDIFDFTIMNLANADALSHIGTLDLTIRAVEAVDLAVGVIKDVVLARDGVLIITSDHGNAESLVYKASGHSETKHNLNPVPFYLIGKEFQGRAFNTRGSDDAQGLLSDVAPTILTIMQEEVPAEMTGSNLLTNLL